MLENSLFKALLDMVPFRAYVIDVKTFEVVYANQLMTDSMQSPNAKFCWEKIFGQNNRCPWCNINEMKLNIENHLNNSYTSEFFDEMDDKWFVSNDKLISWANGCNAKYTEQKANQGTIIQAHAKLSIYTKHLKNINKDLQITKLLLQKKSDELEITNNNLEKIVEVQLKKLRKQNQLLFFHQKQASLNNIMSLIAHQWKQPLHELSINNMFLNEKINNKKTKKIFEDNNEIIQFLSSTISAFQDFYHISNKKSFFLKEAIENTISVLNSSSRQYNININFSYKNENIKIKGQRNIFSQVMLSILENAITILIERNIVKGYININLNILENEIIITIEDNAGGIDEENLPYIFENSKSFRKKPSSGLGLYIANLVISEKFKGSIKARNGELGAIFIISLPYIK